MPLRLGFLYHGTLSCSTMRVTIGSEPWPRFGALKIPMMVGLVSLSVTFAKQRRSTPNLYPNTLSGSIPQPRLYPRPSDVWTGYSAIPNQYLRLDKRMITSTVHCLAPAKCTQALQLLEQYEPDGSQSRLVIRLLGARVVMRLSLSSLVSYQSRWIVCCNIISQHRNAIRAVIRSHLSVSMGRSEPKHLPNVRRRMGPNPHWDRLSATVEIAATIGSAERAPELQTEYTYHEPICTRPNT
jgi:hypothetical protein